MKIRSFQEELLMKQGQLGISTCHHCVDKGKGQPQVLQDSWWLIDVGGLMGRMPASAGIILDQRSSSSCSQRLNTFHSCSVLLGRTGQEGKMILFKIPGN